MERVDTPIRCAESDGGVRLDVYALLTEIWPKMCPRSRFLNIHPRTPSSTVKTSMERVDTPIRCAESDGGLHLDVHALLTEIWPKTCPRSRLLNIHPRTPSSTVRTSVERVDTPIECAESDGVFRLDISTMVIDLWPNTCPIL